MTAPYRIVLSTPAAEVVRDLPHWQRLRVARKLRKLAKSPSSLSRPSVTPPYPPGFQLFEFDVWGTKYRHHFAVLFKYRANEEEIFVHLLGHSKLQR